MRLFYGLIFGLPVGLFMLGVIVYAAAVLWK